MATYTNTLTADEKLWLELNITNNEELRSYMEYARDNHLVDLKVYSDENGVFVSLATTDKPTEVTNILKKWKNIKRVRETLIEHIKVVLSATALEVL